MHLRPIRLSFSSLSSAFVIQKAVKTLMKLLMKLLFGNGQAIPFKQTFSIHGGWGPLKEIIFFIK
jgi:hypothetical protein